MRAVAQRVSSAHVDVDGERVGQIEHGLLVLLGVGPADTEAEAAWIAAKLARMRIHADDAGKFNRSLLDVAGSMLVVSQFTLLADIGSGTRPGFSRAAPPEVAEPLYERFCELVEAEGVPVARGRFGASMQVSLVNDGPVTIVVDRRRCVRPA
jgi:D-tyrosyl-tRNA(Tyr) deacylase